MRKLFLAIVFIVNLQLSAQEQIVVRSFVKEDSVILRWAPSSAELFIEGLKKGYEVSRRKEADGSIDPEVIYTVPPYLIRNILIDSGDTLLMTYDGIIRQMLQSGKTAEEINFTYVLMLLSAGPNNNIANFLGLYYVDRSYEKTKYEYFVSIPGTGSSGSIQLNTTELDEYGDMTRLYGQNTRKQISVYLKWNADSLNFPYCAYWIEKSSDSIHFDRLNKTPYVFMKSSDEKEKVDADFVDTAVTEGLTYYYRVRGITHFGENGKVSNTTKVYVGKALLGECRIDTVYADEEKRIVSGRYLQTFNETKPEHFILYRSDSLMEGYEVIETVSGTDEYSFTLKGLLRTGDRYYYKVAAVSDDGDTTYSFPTYFFTLDQEPPSTPVGLKGEVDDYGIARLVWDENPENDIRGYRLYRSNALHEEFVEVHNRLIDSTWFSDTLRLDNLTSEVYYRISAVDLNYNNSKWTEPVRLMKPDTIPPVPAFIKTYRIDTGGIHIEWYNSPSQDAETHFLVRSGDYQDTILIWSDTLQQCTDQTGEPGKNYRFYIVTTDHSGNYSISNELNLRYETGIRAGVQNLAAKANREEKQIELSWENPKAEIYSIQIFRSINDAGFKLIQTLHEPVEEYIDKNLHINNTYTYRVKVVYASGHSSVLSGGVVVRY